MRFFSLALVVLMLGCSSSDGDDNRGQGGVSGSSSGRVCVPGSTQTCVGPGACGGGQSCAFDGSGWGPCDCGAAAGGSSGSAGGTNTSGSGSVPIGGSAGVSGTSGQAGTGTAGTGTAGTAGSGTAGSGTAGTGAGGKVPDADCPTTGACEKCCNTNHPNSDNQQDFVFDVFTCACSGACLDSCESFCDNQPPTAACNECLNIKFKDKSCAFESCSNADCQAFSTCVLSCP